MFHVYMYLWNWFIITLKKCLILLWVCSDVQCTSQKTKMCQKHHWPIVYQLVIHFFFHFWVYCACICRHFANTKSCNSKRCSMKATVRVTSYNAPHGVAHFSLDVKFMVTRVVAYENVNCIDLAWDQDGWI